MLALGQEHVQPLHLENADRQRILVYLELPDAPGVGAEERAQKACFLQQPPVRDLEVLGLQQGAVLPEEQGCGVHSSSLQIVPLQIVRSTGAGLRS